MSSDSEQIRQKVRGGYSVIARKEASSCCGPTSCCGKGNTTSLVKNLGYSSDDLTAVPESANMGLSCGNPSAIASLKEGEVVLDLGSGGGFDAFVAGRRVGRTGRVVGVDMTPDMISLARRNNAEYQKSSGFENVEFRLGEIEHLPIETSSVDVILSNCVLNLSPDKPQVWRDISRVLKPGGRVIISDLLLKKPLPAKVKESVQALVGCVAGAATLSETRTMIAAAGLLEPDYDEKTGAISAMIDTNSDLYQELTSAIPGERVEDYVASFTIRTQKPRIG
ncbi:MAG: arsenite methyltransferase [Candidatus Riflebacteria bacterium]|nr:arsenite methyltransferase [Candidatus Riflebacteria bacterium]